jgi:hypothetical protein
MANSAHRAPEERFGEVTYLAFCPKCGNSDLSTMADLLDLVSKPSSQFSSDMAEWLSPPKRPKRPLSKRHRTGFRNSVAFGLFWIILITVACFALTGAPPNIYYVLVALAMAVVVGFGNWRSESRLASQEDTLLLDAHWERHRAYLQRRRVWTRLRYCTKCGLTIDPVTSQTASLFNIHELANSKVKEETKH